MMGGLSRIGLLLIELSCCRDSLVIEWLGLGKFSKVWCGGVWICGAEVG